MLPGPLHPLPTLHLRSRNESPTGAGGLWPASYGWANQPPITDTASLTWINGPTISRTMVTELFHCLRAIRAGLRAFDEERYQNSDYSEVIEADQAALYPGTS